MKMLRIAIPLILVAGLLVWRIAGRSEFFYAGTIEATEVDLPARVSSVISTITVVEGGPIHRGQPAVLLTCEDIRLAAELAERDYTRAERAYRSGAMPKEGFDRLRTQRDQTALQRSWCSVESPVDGTVLEKYFEPGEWVSPGKKLLTVADLREVWAYLYVPHGALAKLRLGMEVTGILPEMKGKRFPGRISHIRSEAEFTPRNVQTREERTRLVYGVKVTFPNPEGILKPGMTVEVKLPRG